MKLDDVTEDDDGDRYYEWNDGSEYPSVTTIISADPEKQEAIRNWRESHPNPDHYRDRQGQLGRFVHRRVLNQFCVRELPPEPLHTDLLDDDFRADVETATAMWDTAGIDPGSNPDVEVAVRSDEHQYAGRFDLLTTDGLLCDLKISKEVRDSYRLQAAAYWTALEEMDGWRAPDEAAIVLLNPDPQYNPDLTAHVERITAEQKDYWFDRFKKIQRIYNGDT